MSLVKPPSLHIRVEPSLAVNVVYFHLDTRVSLSGAFAYSYDPETGRSGHHHSVFVDPFTEELAQALFRTEGVGCYEIVQVAFLTNGFRVDKSKTVTLDAFVENVVETIRTVCGLAEADVTVNFVRAA